MTQGMADLQTESRLIPLFRTLWLTEQWSEADQWNTQLFDAIIQRRSQSTGASRSNVQGWQSEVDMLEWGGEAARKLCDHVLQRCENHTVDVRQTDQQRFVWLPEMQANVMERGASNQTDCHPGSQWSAIYCVSDGYGGSDDPELGGELAFLDPRFPMVRMRSPDLRFRSSSGAIDHHESLVRPKGGQLVMFPAWLMHSVRPYLGDNLRISIAINVSTRPRWGD